MNDQNKEKPNNCLERFLFVGYLSHKKEPLQTIIKP